MAIQQFAGALEVSDGARLLHDVHVGGITLLARDTLLRFSPLPECGLPCSQAALFAFGPGGLRVTNERPAKDSQRHHHGCSEPNLMTPD
jgi:hypothetical protein